MTEIKPKGRDCITRDGRLAKWVGYRDDDDDYPLVFEINGYNALFKRSGHYYADESEHPLDLVRYADEPEKPEKPKGPVVTGGKVRLALRSGLYGPDDIEKLVEHLTSVRDALASRSEEVK